MNGLRTTALGLAFFGVLGIARPGLAETGTLFVPSLLPKDAPGANPPHLWVYDAAGAPVPTAAPDGGLELGSKIPLEAGTYLIEMGSKRAPENRVRVEVVAGKQTVVPSGLIAITVEPESAQPVDVCATWTGALEAALRPATGPGPLVASTDGAKDSSTSGMLQLLPGYYRVSWNGFGVDVEVKPYTRYNVETGYFGPLNAPDYELAEQEGGKERLRLCQRRATRLLARTYYATHNEPSSEPPFRERFWERITVSPTASKTPAFEPIARPKPAKDDATLPAPVPLWDPDGAP